MIIKILVFIAAIMVVILGVFLFFNLSEEDTVETGIYKEDLGGVPPSEELLGLDEVCLNDDECGSGYCTSIIGLDEKICSTVSCVLDDECQVNEVCVEGTCLEVAEERF
tara:strand:- start:57 stop:383 length:327 start_codon:yes stop_codon:yes gene_type:complete